MAVNERHGCFGSVLHDVDWFWTHLWINARAEAWWTEMSMYCKSEFFRRTKHWQSLTAAHYRENRVTSSYRNSFGHSIDAACGQLFAGYEEARFSRFCPVTRWQVLFSFFNGCLSPSRIRRQSVQRARLLMMIATLPDCHSTDYCSRVVYFFFGYRSYHKARYIEYI